MDDEGYLRAVVILPDGEEVPLAIETSRLLFGVDREAYKLVLNACREAKAAAPSRRGGRLMAYLSEAAVEQVVLDQLA